MTAENLAYLRLMRPFFILVCPIFLLWVSRIMVQRHFLKNYAVGKRLTSNIDVGDVCWWPIESDLKSTRFSNIRHQVIKISTKITMVNVQHHQVHLFQEKMNMVSLSQNLRRVFILMLATMLESLKDLNRSLTLQLVCHQFCQRYWKPCKDPVF